MTPLVFQKRFIVLDDGHDTIFPKVVLWVHSDVHCETPK